MQYLNKEQKGFHIMNRIKVKIKDLLRFLYFSAPGSLRHSSKYKKVYSDTMRLLNEAEKWDEKQIIDYQNAKISEIVKYAYEYVPYYKRLFDENGINPDLIKTVNDLNSIPFLTKEIIKREGDNMRSREYSSKQLVSHLTGGSSGKPVNFWFEKDVDLAYEDATVDYVYSKFGLTKSDKTVIFGDTSFVREAERINPNIVCKKMPGTKRWCFGYTTIENKAKDYLQALQSIKPDWIIACPSHLYRLVSSLKQHGYLEYGIYTKGIIFKSEMLYPFQEKEIMSFFRTNLFQVYGHTEHLCMAFSMSPENGYRMVDTYGISQYLEFGGSKYELIATGIHNRVMPLIRYKTMDLFTLPCECVERVGAERVITSIDGRSSDVLYLKDGRVVTDIFCDFTTLSTELQDDIQQYQITQSEKGKCILKIVPRDGAFLNQQKIEKIKNICDETFFYQMDVSIEIVDSIPRTGRGKEKLIISSIPINE